MGDHRGSLAGSYACSVSAASGAEAYAGLIARPVVPRTSGMSLVRTSNEDARVR
jgi:hypothetical protein